MGCFFIKKGLDWAFRCPKTPYSVIEQIRYPEFIAVAAQAMRLTQIETWVHITLRSQF